MSSKRAAEQLTNEIITELLQILAKSGQAPTAKLTREIVKQLPLGLRPKLRAKGDEREIRRILYYLKTRGYIRLLEGRSQTAIYGLTTQGLRRLEELTFEPLAAQKKLAWDGLWRVLIFDIPEETRLARDAIRRLIKQLGFVPLQKSVWIQPFPCRDEVKHIQDAYGAQNHITLMEVTHFDQIAKFKKLFKDQLKT